MFGLRLNVVVWVSIGGEFGFLMFIFFVSLLRMIVLVNLDLLFHLVCLMLLTVFSSHYFVKIWCFLLFLWFLLIYWVFYLIWWLFSRRSTIKLILIEHTWELLGHFFVPCYIHGRILITLMLIQLVDSLYWREIILVCGVLVRASATLIHVRVLFKSDQRFGFVRRFCIFSTC